MPTRKQKLPSLLLNKLRRDGWQDTIRALWAYRGNKKAEGRPYIVSSGRNLEANSFSMDSPPVIEIIAVTYQQQIELPIFVLSVINQTHTNWKLNVIHDGNNDEFVETMREHAKKLKDKIIFSCTEKRHNDFGHTLRNIGLSEATGDYIVLMNADNYLIPKFVEFVTESIVENNPDVVLFDMVHSHRKPGGRFLPAYSAFETKYKRCSIDVGAAAIRQSLAKTAGFRDNTHDGDASYFEDVAAVKGSSNLKISKVPRILFVHN